jgi:UDP-glucose 4-epimerase
MKSVCVIGGAGFLGSHVADALSDYGYEVRVFDCVESPWLRKDQTMIVGDILDLEALNKAISGCEVVYNYAAISSLNEALYKPIDTIKINVLGNTNVMEACRKNNVKRFIYASTVYVYSREGGFYRCSKQAAEHYVEGFHEAYGLNYTILRFGSIYGPRADQSNGLFCIAKQALETGKIKYVGSPDSMREYIHVEDAARASVTVLNEEFCNQSIVLTGQEAMRVMDMLEMLSEILGLKNAVEFVSDKQFGHYVRTPYAYQPRLGRKYVPQLHVDLGQGLLELVRYIHNCEISIEQRGIK